MDNHPGGAKAAVTAEGLAPTKIGAPLKGMSILVVEDDRISAHLLARLLQRLGHEVTAAADGAAAWALLQRRRFDLVLSDWMMPGPDGLELCRRIRGQVAPPYTYVILVTGRGEGGDRIEALDAGADDFLTKPLDPRELDARLRIAHRLLALQEELTVQGELQQKNDELRALATTDELTGLRNRRRFFEDLGTHFAQSSRGRAPLSLVLLDVDHFKRYNDAFGHPAGDEVLKGVADALQAVTRDYDTVARHGGEEFAVILPGTGLDVARGMAERLRASVERHAWPHRPVTASFGVATAFPRTGDARAIVDEADRALYFSKRGGRNRVTHYADLGDVLVEAPLADSAVPLGSHSRPGPPFDVAGGVPTASPGGQVPTCDDFVDGWARALLLRDGGTVDHSRRATAMVLELARSLGVGEAEMPHIRRGALLHDIGKIGIPDSILLKPGPLTGDEWAVMRRHPGYAYELLSPVDFLRPALDIPYCHHERWDGTGYPRGLKGEQIPLSARAFAAVDVWDALSHDRPYRKAWPAEQVGAHIAALAGTHLDPRVVGALQRMLAPDRTPGLDLRPGRGVTLACHLTELVEGIEHAQATD